MKIPAMARAHDALRGRSPAELVSLVFSQTFGPLLRTPAGVTWVRRWNDWRCDAALGIDTSGHLDVRNLDVPAGAESIAQAYEGVPPSAFRTVFRRLSLPYEEYTFIDFGSGKGRALFLAAEWPYQKIVGVEWSQSLHSIAERNVMECRSSRLKSRNIVPICVDAAEYRLPPVPAVLFFFNPFKHDLMATVASRIRDSQRETPRDLRIVYINPTCREVFDQADFLQLTDERSWYAVYRGKAGRLP